MRRAKPGLVSGTAGLDVLFVGRNPPHLRTPPQLTINGGVAKGTPFRPTRISPSPPMFTAKIGNRRSGQKRSIPPYKDFTRRGRAARSGERHSALQRFHSAGTHGTIRRTPFRPTRDFVTGKSASLFSLLGRCLSHITIPLIIPGY